VTFTDNLLAGNTFGMIIEAAFTRAGTNRRGDITLATSGNVVTGSCQADLLVTLTNGQTGMGIPGASAPYLLGSTFDLTLGGDLSWDAAWYAHAAGFGNGLTVNGVAIPNGTRHSFNPARPC
jgi:hypothetical protein